MSTHTPLEPTRAPRNTRLPADLDPLATLRGEHARLQEAVNQIDWLLAQKSMSASEVEALEEAVRLVRSELPSHLVKEEFALYPEVVAADPRVGRLLPDLKATHLLVEDDFSQLQALVLAFSVGNVSPSLRRQASKAAHKLREDLAMSITREEAATFAAVQRGLSPESMARLRSALAAAEARARLKAERQR